MLSIIHDEFSKNGVSPEVVFGSRFRDDISFTQVRQCVLQGGSIYYGPSELIHCIIVVFHCMMLSVDGKTVNLVAVLLYLDSNSCIVDVSRSQVALEFRLV